MPHRVATFFRAHTNSFDLPTDLKRGPRRSSSSIPNLSNRTPSSSGSSLVSSESGSVKMHDTASKRLSLSGLHSPRSSSNKISQQPQASLDCTIESPPLVFYGPVASSTGALLSGQLILNISDDVMAIEKFEMRLAVEVTRKKPFHAHCTECSNSSSDLMTWKFLQGPATLRRGEHSFPFSFLLQGHLPATMKGGLSTIDYVLRAVITPKSGEPIKFSRNLNVKRAIHASDLPRTSVRIFPPTNITANCTLPHVIHPIGESLVSMRVDGVVKRNVDAKTQTHWRLKRLTWRLDETQKMISPACDKHSAKLKEGDDAKKGLPHQDIRTIGTEELKTGWKSNYSSADGSIELEFPVSIKSDAKPLCDLKAEDGTEVVHVLVVEMIVAEEFAPIKRPSQITPTGAARVLRMHFNVIVTERSGLGISWDEEQPPLYENVPASPPAYGNSELYDGEPIPDYADLSPLDSITEISRPDFPAGSASSAGPSASGPSVTRRLSIADLSLEP